ncbi:MAG: bifunctional phosphopantothenoylcysteine decarboxylase/phosphopantothenate--cysteine ligase CoaBC [Nitrospina sp.]|nr:MAG: bifunctional phosphopantothenoylcysteine decarboxylase/phosphopantothenate--cysteine ligase CoaBC [Nitrospina sp.]
MADSLNGRKIVLGVSGGIAAYKAVELLRLLTKAGASVHVVMTASAKKFVTPLTFATLSGHPVYHEIFDSEHSAAMEHLQVSENADLLIIAPATANTLGKLANGLADDPLSTLFTGYDGTVLVAPAMNDKMWAHAAVQENIRKMKRMGVHVMNPEPGELACGVTGLGRLAEPADMVREIQQLLAQQSDLQGIKFLVTAGPTREHLDPVRFITNRSSGKMGYAVARQAVKRGAEVVLISGPTHLEPPPGVQLQPCQRAQEMHSLVMKHLPDCDVLVMTAAVGDFSPAEVQKEKMKKSDQPLVLHFLPTVDILQAVAAKKTGQFVVGFAAESENVVQSAQEKLKRKQLDLIVANNISAPGIGFQSDNNQVTLIDSAATIEALPLMSKVEIADILLDRIKSKIAPSS